MTASSKLLLGLLAGALLTACAEEASGPIERQTREVGAFTAIDMEGAVELDITVGEGPAVEIEAPAQVVERIKTEVRDDTLYIESKPKDWLFAKGRGRAHVKVLVPTLSSLSLEGGNDVSVQGFAGGEWNIRAEGAVNIEAQGELDRLTIKMAGAGNGDFSRLVANDTHVTVDGVGNVVVHPTERLDATMNGVGAIYYTGTPREVRTRMNGLGHIGKTDGEAPRDPADEPVEIDPEKLQPEYEDEKPRSAGQVI
jgi:hypothetical protein